MWQLQKRDARNKTFAKEWEIAFPHFQFRFFNWIYFVECCVVSQHLPSFARSFHFLTTCASLAISVVFIVLGIRVCFDRVNALFSAGAVCAHRQSWSGMSMTMIVLPNAINFHKHVGEPRPGRERGQGAQRGDSKLLQNECGGCLLFCKQNTHTHDQSRQADRQN